MKRIRYMFMAMALLMGAAIAHGQDTFDPVSPAEPGSPTTLLYYQLTVQADDESQGSVSGGGRYRAGTNVTVRATAKTDYTFVCWTNSKDEAVSTSASYSFTTIAAKETLTAHFRPSFDPGSPSEPADPSLLLYYPLTLKAEPANCGSVSGGGKYQANTNVTLRASAATDYAFSHWTNAKGETISSAATYYFTTPAGKDTLTAHFLPSFNPGSPVEPSEPILRHRVTSSCADGGYVSGTSNGRYLEGTTVSFTARANSGYSFSGWYKDGELYTTSTYCTFTVEKDDVVFYALFVFNPSSPGEPLQPKLDSYSFYLMTVNTKPGRDIDYPIWFVNKEDILNMTLQLTFPPLLMPDTTNITLGEKCSDYELAVRTIQDTVLVLNLTGGRTTSGTAPLLTFHVEVPDTMEAGFSRQVKINQISLMEVDSTTVTARTRNGRIGVYRSGDSNGDGNVTVTDVSNTIANMLEMETETYIFEAADANEDGIVSLSDVTLTVDIAMERDEASNATALRRSPSSEWSLTNDCLLASDLTLGQGEQGTLEIALKNKHCYTALMADLYLPEGVRAVCDEDGYPMVSLTDGNGRTHLIAASQVANGALRLLSASFTNEAFAADGEDAVLRVKVACDNDATVREARAELRDVTLVSAEGRGEYAAPDTWAKLTLQGGTTIKHTTAAAPTVHVEGRSIVVDAAEQESIVLATPDGRSQRISVQEGRNVLPIARTGIYIVNGMKVVVK